MRRHFPLAFALLLAAGGQTEVWLADVWRGPQVLDALAALAPLALVMVRERPRLVAAVVGVVYAVDIALFGSPASVTQFFTMTAALFWTAMLAPPRSWLVLGGAAGLLVLTQLRDPEELDPGSRVFPFIFLALTWTVGTMVHNRQRLAASLAVRAQRLEAEQELVARAAVLDERVRIARELHDVVAHSVSVMVVQAVAGRKTLAAGRDGADGAFEAIEATGQQALTEMRRLLGVLRQVEDAPLLVPQPGLDQLGALVEQAREAGLGVDLAVDGAVRPLSPGTDLSAYRIVQEALTNVIRHAPGARTTVRVIYSDRDVTLDVADAGGVGAASPPNGAAHGIVGMRERAALYGGTLEAGPREGGGFAVRVRLPIEAA